MENYTISNKNIIYFLMGWCFQKKPSTAEAGWSKQMQDKQAKKLVWTGLERDKNPTLGSKVLIVLVQNSE